MVRTFSDEGKLKGLEEENAKLKRLLSEQMLDVATLKEMLAKTFRHPVDGERP